MIVKINGESKDIVQDCSITQVVGETIGSSKTKGIAVAVNGTIVRRTNWQETYLKEGDEVEILQAFAGG